MGHREVVGAYIWKQETGRQTGADMSSMGQGHSGRFMNAVDEQPELRELQVV